MTGKASEETREEAANKLFMSGAVTVIVKDSSYQVQSETRSGFHYDVMRDITDEWTCTCPDFTYHNAKCKHIRAVERAIDSSKLFTNTITTAENIKRRLVARTPMEDEEREIERKTGLKTELTDLDWKLIQDSLARTSASFYDILHKPALDKTRGEVLQLEYDSLTELLGKVGRIRKQRHDSSQL